jgi:hypothetical protein
MTLHDQLADQTHDAAHAEKVKSPPARVAEAGVSSEASANATSGPAVPPLPTFPAQIPIGFEMPNPFEYDLLDRSSMGSSEDFILRLDLAHVSLLRSYDCKLSSDNNLRSPRPRLRPLSGTFCEHEEKSHSEC